MTYRLYLTNSATGVEITPEYNYQEKDRKIESRTRTTTGAEYVYKFGSFNAWKFNVEFVNSSFYAVVNSWWISNSELIFVKAGTSDVSSVMLTNKTKPISKFIKPHDDLYRGIIELSTY